MPSFIDTFGHFSAVMHGVIVSSILIPSALTALVAGAFAHRFGQIRLVAIGSLIYATGAALECSAPVLGVFIFGRVVKGVGEGFFLSNVYVQVSEMSPAGIRGIMTAMPQFLITVGIVLGYFLCYGTSRLGSSSASWRVPLAIASGLGLLFSNCIWITPLSPRWLVAQGRIDEARIVLRKLGLDQSEQEELLAQAAISDAKLNGDATLWEVLRQTWVEFGYAFSKPYRGRTAFGCFIMGMQQWAGIDGVLYYAPILFQNAGLDGEQASFLASGASAIVILAVTIPATIFADRWGRRTASIFGGIGMTVLMTLIGTMYAADQVTGGSGVGKWVVIISIYLFAVVFSVTWALSFRTYLVESLPKQTRSSASSLAQCSNWVSVQ
jgi:sugar porter (SP) family MFS transporter